MKISFYPGCSLEGMAKDYFHAIDAVFNPVYLIITARQIDDEFSLP